MNNNNKNDFYIKKQKQLIIYRILMYGLIIFLISLLVYSNSLEGDFCFDDQFAIVNNKDVTGGNNDGDSIEVPTTMESYRHSYHNEEDGGHYDLIDQINSLMEYLSKLLKHDFWGQDITKIDSHKSYRPLTTLSFRLNYITSDYKLNAYSFHMTNVFLHSVVSVYIFFISLLVFKPIFNNSNISNNGRSSFLLNLLGIDELCSFLTALLFSLHPIHTEAVSGIVGRSELLCTFFLMLSLLAYYKCCFINITHWSYFMVSMIFLISSTLSKETGFSLVFILPITDLLLIQIPNYYQNNKKKRLQNPISGQFFKRTFVISIIGLIFLYVRKLITIDMVLNNFRLLENPIARESDLITRVLSLMNLHSRYLWLLIFPKNLSADWSFNCIPLIKDISNPLNLLSLLSYSTIIGLLLYCSFKIKLFSIIFKTITSFKNNKIKNRNQDDEDDEEKDQINSNNRPEYYHSILWCILFGIISFLPSSNIFFYVGTSIGERLLYIPSIAYCLLLSRFLTLPLVYLSNYSIPTTSPVATAAVQVVESPKIEKSTLKKRSTKNSTQSSKPVSLKSNGSSQLEQPKSSIGYKLYLILMLIIVISLSIGYSIKTWERNEDWKDEGSLFKSALNVCPDSAKVQYNLGILYRRTKEWDVSIQHFNRAKQILPDYCDVDYFYALTLLNKNGDYNQARPYLNRSMSCRYTQVRALESIQQLMTHMLQSDSENGQLYSDWAYFEKDLQPVQSAMHYHKAALIYNNKNAKKRSVELLNLSLNSLSKVTDSMLNQKTIEQDKIVIKELFCQDNIWLSAGYFDLKNNEKSILSLNQVYDNCRDFKKLWNEGLLSLVNLKLLKIKQQNEIPSIQDILLIHTQMNEIDDKAYHDSSFQFLAQYAQNFEKVDWKRSIKLYKKLLSISNSSSSYYYQLPLLRLSHYYKNININNNEFKKYFDELDVNLINEIDLKKYYSELK